MKNQNLCSKTLSISAALPVRKQYPTEAHGRVLPDAREDCRRGEMCVKQGQGFKQPEKTRAEVSVEQKCRYAT